MRQIHQTNRLAVLAAAGVPLCLLPTAVHAYSATASVTFAWGGSSEVVWTSNGVNTIPTFNNGAYISQLAGFNASNYYNADFAAAIDYGPGTADDCLTPLPGYETITLRKYGCRHTDTVFTSSPYAATFQYAPATDAGGGGTAIGVLTVTDTSLTGTLTIVSTTDEPQGGTTTIISGTRIGVSSGDGASGFNLRFGDGSPFGNAWWGVSTAATLQVNLNGTFTSSAWNFSNGTVKLSDPGFACQQGGYGGDSRGTLCTPSTIGGGFQNDGSGLSWGMDVDGASTGSTSIDMIDVRDATGVTNYTTLAGVLADLAVDLSGNITTNSGEYRRAAGSAGGGCANHIRYDGTKISCGTLYAGSLTITGVATETGTDATPNPFSFTPQTNVAVSTQVTAAPVEITGIDTGASVSVSGGEYSIGCTASFTSGPGTIYNHQYVCVRHTSAATYGTAFNTLLTVGGVPAYFTSTTKHDTEPNAFTFADETDVPFSSVRTSAPVIIQGISRPVAISVAGGTYSIGCSGTYTSTAGTVSQGQSVCVRHTSAAAPGTPTNTTLTVGESSGAPENFAPQSDTFTSTTLTPDTTPDPFSFTDLSGVAVSTVYTSAPVTITGINIGTAISVAGEVGPGISAEYSIGCTGSFTSAAGTIQPGQTVCVRHTSAAANSTSRSTTLTVGGVSDLFTTTTGAAAPDTTPEAFSFADQSPVALSATIVSAPVVITGINTAAPISVSGQAGVGISAEYSIGCTGSFTSAAGTINNGQTVCVRHTSRPGLSAARDTTLSVGGVSDTFTSTTLSDATPDQFTFIGLIPVGVNTTVTSNTVTITGISGPTAISVENGLYSIGCTGTFTSSAATVGNGQTVCVRHTTASTENTSVSTTLDVGGVRDPFTSVTEITAAPADTAALPVDTGGIDPRVTLDYPTQGLTTRTDTDPTDKPGTIVVTSCAPLDPRESEGPGSTFNPRYLALSELTECPALAMETAVIPPWVRGYPDVNGDVRFVISAAATTAEFSDDMLLSEGDPTQLVTYVGGEHPPCNAPLDQRPLWFYGMRVGETGALVGEDSTVKSSSIQCNQSRTGGKKYSVLGQAFRRDDSIYSSESYVAEQLNDLQTTLTKLAADDDSCSDTTLPALTAALQGHLDNCRKSTVFATITRDTSVPTKRIGRKTFEYQMKVTVNNPGGIANGVTFKVRSVSPATTTIVGGAGGVVTLNFGTIAAASTTAYSPTWTFKVRQDGSVALKPEHLLSSVDFTPDGSDPTRFSSARAACESICALAKANKSKFASCPDRVKEFKYRGALITAGLVSASSIWDTLEHPTDGGSWAIYPLPTDCVDPDQIPP